MAKTNNHQTLLGFGQQSLSSQSSCGSTRELSSRDTFTNKTRCTEVDVQVLLDFVAIPIQRHGEELNMTTELQHKRDRRYSPSGVDEGERYIQEESCFASWGQREESVEESRGELVYRARWGHVRCL